MPPVPMHIGHLALRATDPERSATFLGSILGLRRTVDEPDRILLSCNEKHHEIELLAGERPGLDHLGLEVERDADLEALRDRVVACGGRVLSERDDEPGLGRALRVVGPMGLVYELYTSMAREPLSVAHYMPPLARRFGHVTLATEDLAGAVAFATDALGFRVTDTLGDRLAWLRCDADHHGIAFVQTGKNELHHYAFQLEGWSQLEQYADHLARIGQRIVWGVGRHGPGRNLFTYIPDPDNTIVEAYSDLLQVLDDANYTPIDWDDNGGELALNLWGPLMPPGWRDYGVPVLAPQPAHERI